MRVALHEAVGHVMRASLANAPRHPRIRDQLQAGRSDQRDQFAAHFAPEIAGRAPTERDAVLSAGDLLTQIESIDYLRRHRRLTVAETSATVSTALRALLS